MASSLTALHVSLRKLPAPSASAFTAAAVAAPRRTLRRRSPAMRKATPYLLVAPAVIYLLMITLYPGAFAIWQSFYVVRFNQMIPGKALLILFSQPMNSPV